MSAEELKVAVFNDGGITKIRTLEPIVFKAGKKEFIVPAGYVSEGMSVPRACWSIISPTINGRTLIPSVVHDYMYETHCVGRKQADVWFRDALVQNGFGRVKSQVVYRAVRIFGGSHW